MTREGITWMPSADSRDNKKKYDRKENTEKVYLEKVKEYERTVAFLESLYESGETIDSEKYNFLRLPVEERLKAPDADFVYNGLHKSMIPAIYCSSKSVLREHFRKEHKGGLYTRIRVPSLKKSMTTWRNFYDKFPKIAAEVRLGTRRFVNGAKLKYIW